MSRETPMPAGRPGSGTGVLILGKVTIAEGSVLGPYSHVGPVTAGNVLPEDTKTGMIWSGVLPALSSNSSFRSETNPLGVGEKNDRKNIESTVWTPAIPTWMQFMGFFTFILIHTMALVPGMALFYYVFITVSNSNLVPAQYYWFALYHFFWAWIFGIPLATLIIAWKWIFIGKFKEGPTTRSLDNRRWMLQCLMQSVLTQTFLFYGASCPFIGWVYKGLGTSIGWNAQVMPFFCNEFDLLDIGENVSFGGQVSIFCRDYQGNYRGCSIGDNTAVTNSAIMMAGSSVGKGGLVGDLTLLPNDTHVGEGQKCVGSPCVMFPGSAELPEKNVFYSNYIMSLHMLGSLLLELISQPSWLVITWGLFLSPWVQAFSGGPGGIYGYGGFVLIILLMVLIMIGMTLTMGVIFKRITTSFTGTYPRDCFTFVQFMYMTKIIVNLDRFFLRIMGGTPWMPLYYKLMGINASLSSVLLNRHTADIDMLAVGDNAILAFDSYIELHQKTATTLMFEPIVIGDYSAVGTRSILLRGSEVESTGQLQALSMVLPGEPVLKGAVWGGLPSRTYYAPSATEQLRSRIGTSVMLRKSRTSLSMGSGKRSFALKKDSMRVSKAHDHLNQRLSRHSQRLSNRQPQSLRHSRSAGVNVVIQELRELDDDVDVDMVVVGSGFMGLLGAYEFLQAGQSVLVLEKTDSPFGCWRSKYGANPTSHVAVTEPSYRFPLPDKVHGKRDAYPKDYTPQPDLMEAGQKFIDENGLGKSIQYRCEVTNVEHVSNNPPRARVTYHNHDDNTTTTVTTMGVYIAMGAQQKAREIVWEGENEFLAAPGTYSGYGVMGDVDPRNFHRKDVVIIGNGAFAVENVRTALMHGANHVTMIFRRNFQTWPRVVHYLASLGGLSFGQLGEHYEAWKEWAGMNEAALGKDGMDIMMSLNTFSQPSASDFIFGAHKSGMLTIVKDEVARCVGDVGSDNGGGPGVILKNSGRIIPCQVFLKCLGWRMPELKSIMPSFKTRKWFLLNETPNISFTCDPHYQVDALNSSDTGKAKAPAAKKKLNAKVAAARYALMMETVPKGGTFSNVVIARVVARMQMLMMNRPQVFERTNASLQSSTHAMCSWFEQRYDGWEHEIPELQNVINDTLDEFKEYMTDRFPDMGAFVKMVEERFYHDMGKTQIGSSALNYPMRIEGGVVVYPKSSQ